MTDANERRTCTVAERALLDKIACWPEAPALVYSVSTPEGWAKSGVNARATSSFAPDHEPIAVTHDRAVTAARRLIGSHFGLDDRARITVPPRKHVDDDFVLMAYIRQQRGRIGRGAVLTTGDPLDPQHHLHR